MFSRFIDLYQRILTLTDSAGNADGKSINIDDVVEIDGDIFAEYE